MNATPEHYLTELESFFADSQVCRDCSNLLVHFSIRLAALGRAAEVLAIIEQSPEAELFTALSEGLRLYLGWPAESPAGHAGEIAAKVQEAVAEFAFDREALTEPATETEASIEYGFVRAAVSAA